MKKIKYTIFTIMLFLICITNTYAACTQEEINEFKKIEDEYTVKYEYDKATGKYNLYFTATQKNKYYYEIYADNEFKCSSTSDNTIKCNPFASGNHEILIVGVTNTCNDVLKTLTLELPKYNKLSEDPLCEGIEEFVLCNPSYSKDITYEEFVSRVETYKKNKQNNETKQEKETTETSELITNLINYVKENWIQIIIVIAFIILVTITVIINVKSARKSRRLE